MLIDKCVFLFNINYILSLMDNDFKHIKVYLCSLKENKDKELFGRPGGKTST